jgi:DNA mismatch repair protein MutL
VVKELLENALDANATTVGIEVREGGRRLIRVSDDGCGIPADEVAIAFHRHSTSKLREAADLDAIETLGFRGEALASIASVAQVTLVTRAQGETAGSRLSVEGGRIGTLEKVGAPQGTVVGVENLFFNVPARLKFLRTVTTEKRHISALVTRYAMAYPQVRFRLVHDGRLVFKSPGSGSLRDVIIEVYGLETARQMLPVEDGEGGEVRVGGYTGAPSLNRANRTGITFFVNGRWIQDAGLTYAVSQAYHTMLMTGRHPVAVIMVDLPPAEVDVNVHPTKAEIRFRDKEAVFRAVQRSVRRTLVESAPGRATTLAPDMDGGWSATAQPVVRAALAGIQPAGHYQPEMDLTGLPGDETDVLLADPVASPEAKLPALRIVGQVGAAYIVAEGPDGLVLIDQHAAHERILYEQYLAQRESGVVTQTLLEPAAVDLSPERAALLEEHLNILAELGFVIEFFGGSTFMVRGLPALLGDVSSRNALEAVVDDLERGDRPLEATMEEGIIGRVCKTAAVKAGQVLTRSEMSAMVRQLENCASPQTCPHGRPTMLHFSAAQLAKQFGRL